MMKIEGKEDVMTFPTTKVCVLRSSLASWGPHRPRENNCAENLPVHRLCGCYMKWNQGFFFF